MTKRSAGSGNDKFTLNSKKQKKAKNIFSKESISSKSEELLSSITTDDLDVTLLVSLIALYDKFIEKFQTEDGLESSEDNARLLNLQLFKVFEKLFVSQKNFGNKLKQSYELYKFNLLFFIENIPFDCSLIVDNLDIYMKLLKLESVHFAPLSKDGDASPYFPTKSFKDLIIALFKSSNGGILGDGTSSSILIQEFISSYYSKYQDLQFYFISEIPIIKGELDKNLEDIDQELLFSKFLTVMKEKNVSLETEVSHRTFVSNLPSTVSNGNHYRTGFERTWLYFLSKILSAQQYKTTLLILHKRIIPFFNKPTSLMDFLTDSYEEGGIISILALNGLFELIKKYNLDYPNFYTKLYTLFDEKLLHVKYRSRFLRLSDLFLGSTHLPAALVASFIKKLARLSIDASPSAIVSVIPFVYNLLKRHPTCMILLQNTHDEDYKDPFNNSEKDPLKTNAIESSIWELETLQSHYHPNVATLAKIFSQPFRKQSYNMEDFLDWSYSSLLDSESSRRLKAEVALEYDPFASLLGDYVKNWGW